jgi:tetratricopeptide (TPR) repeat protein
VGLAVLYPHPNTNWSLLAVLPSGGALLTLTLLCLGQARRRPWLITGWLWFVGTLLPVIGLAQGGDQAWADRFTYWPHIGLFIAIAWTLAEVGERFRISGLPWGVGVALTCLAGLTWVQVGYWRNTVTLWERALAVTTENNRAHLNLGKYYLDREHFDVAQAHFEEAVRIRPDSATGQSLDAVALLSLGKLDQAGEHFRAAVALAPEYSDAWYNLGVTRLRQGQSERALRCFRKVIELQPASTDALAPMGLALWRIGKPEEAVRCFQEAQRKNPQDAEAWHGLGLAHLVRGNLDEAIRILERSRQCRLQSVNILSDLGLALARRGKWAQAVSCYRVAIQSFEQNETLLLAMNGQVPAVETIPPIVILRGRMALALDALGDPQASAAQYRAALKRDPQWPQKFTTKARRLLTDPERNLRDPRLAYELIRQAIQASESPSTAMRQTLAAAEATLGQGCDESAPGLSSGGLAGPR